jgi:hypothetical protein
MKPCTQAWQNNLEECQLTGLTAHGQSIYYSMYIAHSARLIQRNRKQIRRAD